jgi:hypothetical protein
MNRLFLIRVLWHCCLHAGGILVFQSGLASHALAADTETSRLWGLAGERWERDGRLPDYSYAGYFRGERPLPELQSHVSVKDYGAVGDGQTDDTAAIKRALKEASGKVIAFPSGRYVITEILEIQDSGTILQGAGPHQTVLYVPKPLEKIRSNMGSTTGGRPTSNYSWSGGIIWARGKWDGKMLSKVTVPARRGAKMLMVDEPDRFEVGGEIRLTMRDDAKNSLTHHLYAGDPGDIDNLKSVRESWIARVVEVDRTKRRIVFDRLLRTDVRPEWEPVLYAARCTTEEIGIEHLAIEFPVTPYQGHFTELGYNAIAYSGVRNSWVRNVAIRHADSGIFISGANTTVTDVVWISDRKRDGTRNSTGHHGITLGGTDQLLCNFDIRTKYIHDITMSRGSAGNVVRNGRGEDLTCDHHKYANNSNLYTDIDAGTGTNIFRSGGGAKLGRHCGAWTTWWNIRTDRPIGFPVGWATDMINIIGVCSDVESITNTDGRWFERIPPGQLSPSDLYESQLKRRLDRAH